MPRNTPVTAANDPPEGAVRFSLLNAGLLAAGVLSIVLGYVTLAAASTVAAPLLLVLGYCILIPAAIIL